MTRAKHSSVRPCTAEEVADPRPGIFYFTCRNCGSYAVDLGSSERDRQLVVRSLVTAHLSEQETA